MNRETYRSKLQEMGLGDWESYHREAFARNIGLLTEEEQLRLAHAKVAIPGMGGVGGLHLISLVRSGVGRFHLADFDSFEPANLNRQFGAKVPNFGKSKLECMTEEALSINPFLEIKAFSEGVTSENIDRFLDDADVVLDGLDFFQLKTRRQVFNRAREKGIHVITAGPLGFSGVLLIFSPEKGLGFDDYFNISEGMADEEMSLRFALGLAPRATHIKYLDLKKVDLSAKAGPSSTVACQICSSTATMEALRIILKKDGVKPVPHYVQFDPYVGKYRSGYLLWGNKNPLQRAKKAVVKHLLKRKMNSREPLAPQPPKIEMENGSIPESVIRYIVQMGILAPSADNCQPWNFRWDGSCLTLSPDQSRTGFFYDVQEESTLITFGAVLENMSIAASHYGLEIEYALEQSDGDFRISIWFKRGKIERDWLHPFLPYRRTNRKPYRKDTIRDKAKQELREEVSAYKGCNLFLYEEQETKKVLNKIIFDADRILFEDQRLHQGLFQWVRMETCSDAPDGMDLSDLEMTGVQRYLFPLFGKWRFVEKANKLGLSRIPGINSLILLRKTPAYALLTVNSRSAESYMKSGRAMERFWTQANSLGLALQPMAGFVFLLNHYYHDGASQFAEGHKQKIESMYSEYKKAVGDEGGFPAMFFRVGYPIAEPKARSSRRSMDQVMAASE